MVSFELVFGVSLDIYPEVESLGYKEVPFLIFWGIAICVFLILTWEYFFDDFRDREEEREREGEREEHCLVASLPHPNGD